MGRLNESTKGNSNILFLESGTKKRVRLIFDGQVKKADGSVMHMTQNPLGSWWHRIKEDAGTGRKFHNWLCIGKYRNCPLCFDNGNYEATLPPGTKPKNADRPWPLGKKTYVNAFVYDDGKVKVVPLGNDLWEKLQTIEKATGIDIDQMDVVLTRNGQGLTTTYDAVPMPSAPFVLSEGQFLLDLEEQVAISDKTKEELDEVLSGEFDRKFAQGASGGQRPAGQAAGGVDAHAAGATLINFGQHAGKTLAQIATIDVRYVQWLAVNSNDPNIAQAAAAVVQATVPMAPPAAPPAAAQAPVAAGAPPPPVYAPPAATVQAPAPAVPAAQGQPLHPAPAPAAAPVAQVAPLTAPAPAGTPPLDPFAAMAAQGAPAAKTIDQLRAEAITKASGNPAYRDMNLLRQKMQQAGGGTDLNAFTAAQLESLISIL